jgi:uncharacterized membrane protein
LAGLDAIIEPLINGLWYYMLDKVWSKYKWHLQKDYYLDLLV